MQGNQSAIQSWNFNPVLLSSAEHSWDFWPTLLSSAEQRDQSSAQSWYFQTMYLMEAFVWESTGWALGCMATLLVGKSNLPCDCSKNNLEKGKCPPSFYRLAGTTHNERLNQPWQVPGTPTDWVQLCRTKEEWLRAGALEVWDPQGLLSGTGAKCLAPSCGLGWHHLQWELYPLKHGMVELAPAEGMMGCTQPEPELSCSRGN